MRLQKRKRSHQENKKTPKKTVGKGFGNKACPRPSSKTLM